MARTRRSLAAPAPHPLTVVQPSLTSDNPALSSSDSPLSSPPPSLSPSPKQSGASLPLLPPPAGRLTRASRTNTSLPSTPGPVPGPSIYPEGLVAHPSEKLKPRRKFFRQPKTRALQLPKRGRSPAPVVPMEKILRALGDGELEKKEGMSLRKDPQDDEEEIAGGTRGKKRKSPPAEGEPEEAKPAPKPQRITKDYLSAGLYCQVDKPITSQTLVARVLKAREEEAKTEKVRRAEEKKTKGRKSEPLRPVVEGARATRTRASLSSNAQPLQESAETDSKKSGKKESVPVQIDRPTLPPLPYDFGYTLFFGKQHDFELPFNIKEESAKGVLDGKKKPDGFTKIRANVYPERQKIPSDIKAVCRCDPESHCGEQCINRIMSYLCGKGCPCADGCENRSLNRRKGPSYKVAYDHEMGARGFGIVMTEDVAEGDFVMDYRGEVIDLDTFRDRICTTYKLTKNYYALSYSPYEVIDAGLKGNDARFINHGCAPNLEVRKYQTLGDGWEEYEVGMWALRDIKKGEELFYDYNFEHFSAQPLGSQTRCACGAPNCTGYFGRRPTQSSSTMPEASRGSTDQAPESHERGQRSGKSVPFKGKMGKRQPAQPAPSVFASTTASTSTSRFRKAAVVVSNSTLSAPSLIRSSSTSSNDVPLKTPEPIIVEVELGSDGVQGTAEGDTRTLRGGRKRKSVPASTGQGKESERVIKKTKSFLVPSVVVSPKPKDVSKGSPEQQQQQGGRRRSMRGKV
ncbi:hypothetical protein IAR50_006340 [Cryptococcus sp. DSM 104548]